MRFLSLLACLALAACSTRYKVAPSTGAISTRVAVAKESSRNAQVQTAAAEAKTIATQAASKGVADEIDGAMAALAAHDYNTAAQHLIQAKVGHATVMAYLDQTRINLVSARSNFDSVATQLNGAETEIATLKTAIEKQTVTGADDHVVATRCKRWFGIGALFYGVERLLTAGIVGILILVGVAIALVVAGYFIGGPFGGIVMSLVDKFFKRK